MGGDTAKKFCRFPEKSCIHIDELSGRIKKESSSNPSPPSSPGSYVKTALETKHLSRHSKAQH
eukprot:scaffold4829_cov129-Cylindrotheca_fusiformis.AAC.25